MEHQEGLEPPKTEFAVPRFVRFGFWCRVERVRGVEPLSSTWKAEARPLDQTRYGGGCDGWTHTPRVKRLSPCSGLPGCEAGPAGPSRG